MGSVRTSTDPWRIPIFYAKTRTPPKLIIPNYQVVVMLWSCCCEQLGIRHNNIKHGLLFKMFFKSRIYYKWPCSVFNQFWKRPKWKLGQFRSTDIYKNWNFAPIIESKMKCCQFWKKGFHLSNGNTSFYNTFLHTFLMLSIVLVFPTH